MDEEDDTVDFAPLFPTTISDTIRFENREFIYEAISLLNRCQRHIDPEGGSPVYSTASKPINNLIFYGFLALALARDAERDAAAIAIYHSKSQVRVYYTKNEFLDGDDEHTEKLANLVRSTARDPAIDKKTFYQRYFNLIVHGCHGKFSRRFHDLRDQLKKGKRRQEKIPCTAVDLLELYAEYAKDVNSDSTIRCNADREAKTYSSTGNLFNGLFNALKEMISTVSQDEKGISVDEFTTLAAHAYVIGHATFSGYLIKTSPPLHPLIQSAQNMAEYFCGATRLYNSITDSQSARKRYSNLEPIKIPAPEPLQVTLETDWYHVLKCIYYRTTGKYLPITRGQFIASHGPGVAKYENWPIQKFTSHCEITLMRPLTYVHKRPPTVLGVSKACCSLCFEFIRAVNEHRATYSQILWKVGRSHGNVYNWSLGGDENKSMLAGTAAVGKWVYNKVLTMIQDCIYKSVTESPPSFSSPEEDEGPSASMFLPQTQGIAFSKSILTTV